LPFTAYVLREALIAYGTSGLTGPCSVNVPPALLSDPGFIPTVRQVLDDTGTEPAGLCIEVTERGLMRVADHVSRATAQLHEIGCFVAMDDFGSGSTSLAHLARLGFDSLKVDRQIIADIDGDPINRAVLEGIVRIADAAGLQVIAEGVETEAERAVAVELGCHGMQGYLFDRPAQIDAWADQYR
jgi:EAL domain-containing protein (putative c-di-GMP-specific phosphodiesterase class I)